MLNWFLSLNLATEILLVYFLVINIVTFFYFGLDKLKAQMNNRRISEKMLLILALIGGSLGALLAMKFFRHKTKKVSFQSMLIIILAVQVLIIFLVLNKAGGLS